MPKNSIASHLAPVGKNEFPKSWLSEETFSWKWMEMQCSSMPWFDLWKWFKKP
jgi:hypothetical protein